MKNFNQFVNEDDNLKRSMDGARKFDTFPKLEPIKGNTNHNFKVYEDIVAQYPHIKHIIEEIFKPSPEYALYDVWEQDNSFTFYFHQSMSVYMGTGDNAEFLKKYKVSVQVPGNQDYTFSITIRKEEN